MINLPEDLETLAPEIGPESHNEIFDWGLFAALNIMLVVLALQRSRNFTRLVHFLQIIKTVSYVGIPLGHLGFLRHMSGIPLTLFFDAAAFYGLR